MFDVDVGFGSSAGVDHQGDKNTHTSTLTGLNSTVRTTRLCSNVCMQSPLMAFQSLAVESADPVAARVAPPLSFADHTAPVCPSKVPIQSPVTPSRSMGNLSWDAERKKRPSA